MNPTYQTLISVSDLQENLQNETWCVIDCRFNLGDTEQGARDYEEGHIPGSQYAHLDKHLSGPIVPGVTGRHPLPKPEDLVDHLRRWGVTNRSQVIAYDGGNGGIAARLWWILRWLGHDAVAVLDGGWAAWVESGGPQSIKPASAPLGDFNANLRKDLLVDRQRVENVRRDKHWVVVDARARERYLGLVEPIDPIAGHIEGALNHPFSSNLKAEGIWKDPQELRKELEVTCAGFSANHTIFYCGSGVTACHDILAYKYAGLGDALLYPGSWSEWINYLPR